MAIISVITVNFNNAAGLKRTISSVISQTKRDDIEFIIVDGNSTDGSKELIVEYDKFVDKWVSEPDDGIYDAMNKGVKMCTGEYVLFVNSGDKLASSDTIEKILETSLSADLNFFRVKNCTNNEESFHIWEPPSESALSFLYLQSHPLHHPGAVIKRELQEQYPYPKEFRICADRYFFIKALVIKNCSYSKSDIIINCMEPQNTSGASHAIEMEQENLSIAKMLLPPRLFDDIKKTRWDILQTTQRLVKYYGISRFICAFDNLVLNIIEKFKNN